jgi:hypothetical protein
MSPAICCFCASLATSPRRLTLLPSTCSWPRLTSFRFGADQPADVLVPVRRRRDPAHRQLVDHALGAVHGAQARQQGRLAGVVGDGAGTTIGAAAAAPAPSARAGAASQAGGGKQERDPGFTWRLR